MQRCTNFIEDQYSRHQRRVWKMSRQAGMIGGNRAAHFKGHVSKVFLMPAAPATQAAILLRLRRNRNPAGLKNRTPELLSLPVNQLFRSSARCTFPAGSQAQPIAIGRKSSRALCFLHPKL